MRWLLGCEGTVAGQAATGLPERWMEADQAVKMWVRQWAVGETGLLFCSMRRSMIEVYRLSGTKIHHPISDSEMLFLPSFRHLKIASSSQAESYADLSSC